MCKQEWSPSHNLKSLKKKQLAAREAMARQTTLADAEQSSVESSVIRSDGVKITTVIIYSSSSFSFSWRTHTQKKIYWRMKTCNVKLRNLHKTSIKWPYNSWTVIQNFLCTQRFIIHLKNYTEIDYKLHWNWSPLSAVAQMLFALTHIQTWRCIAPCLMTLITLVLLWPAVPWQVWTCWSINEITVEGNTFIALKKLKDDFKWLQWHSMLLLTFWAFCHCQLSTVVV